MKAAIIEDEKPAARLLLKMLKELRPQWDIELIEGSIEAACDWFVKNTHPDLIFLDIQLADGNSFLFIEQAKPKSVIIFTTAYDEYALNAFAVNSIDYILKPIKSERLNEAVVKYEKLVQSGIYADSSVIADVLKSMSDKQEKKYRSRFLIEDYNGMLTLDVADISYIYLQNKITFAVTFSGKEYVINDSLDKLVEQLDPDMFFRANRQTILTVKSIAKIESWFGGKISITTNPPSTNRIIISRERVSQFKLWLNY